MHTKYAVRITANNFALIQVLHPTVEVVVKENQDRYFLFTADSSTQTTTDHDIMEEDDLYNEDGYLKVDCTILMS